MKLIKFIAAFLFHPKYELVWVIIWSMLLFWHLLKHFTVTTTAYNLTLVDWDLAHAIVLVFALIVSVWGWVRYKA